AEVVAAPEPVDEQNVEGTDHRNARTRYCIVQGPGSRSAVKILPDEQWRTVPCARSAKTGRLVPILIQVDEAGLQAVADRQQARQAHTELAVLKRVRRVAAGLDDVLVGEEAAQVDHLLAVLLKEAAGLDRLSILVDEIVRQGHRGRSKRRGRR